MDETNGLTDSILQSGNSSLQSTGFGSDSGSSGSSATDSDSGTGFFSGFLSGLANINTTTWIIIFVILAFLGFNIFVYLGKGTQTVASFVTPLIEKISGLVALVTGKTVDVAAEGTKQMVNITADTVDTGLSTVQDVIPDEAKGSVKSQPITETVPQLNQQQNDSLTTALDASKPEKQQPSDYEGVEAPSTVHSGGKSGWCYVGEDRGFRTCSEVGVNDTCMSGDIFPSNELCINPNLRA